MAIPKKIREQVYVKYGGRCAYCGKPIEYKDMQVDHMIPQRVGGTDDIENLMPSCRRCNHYKRGNTLEGFRKMIEAIPPKLYRDNYIFKVGVDYGFFNTAPQEVYFYFELMEGVKDEKHRKVQR